MIWKIEEYDTDSVLLTIDQVIDKPRGKALADEFQVTFFECSAKANVNVDQAFSSIVRDVMKRLPNTVQQQEKVLPLPKPKPQEKSCCVIL